MKKQIHPTTTIFLDKGGTIQFYPPKLGQESYMLAAADIDRPEMGSAVVILHPHEIEALIVALNGELKTHRRQ